MDVLIVDDTPGMLMLLQHAVEERGHTATVCADGRCALEAFQIAPYPLILLDWEMPGPMTILLSHLSMSSWAFA